MVLSNVKSLISKLGLDIDEEVIDVISRYDEKSRRYKPKYPEKRSDVARNIEAIATGLKYVVKPMRLTVDYPNQVLEQPKWYRGMFSVKDDVCIGCSLCDIVCPSDAIRMTLNKDKKKRPVINWGRCIFCYYCVDICPVEAFDTSTIHDAVFTRFEDMLTTLNEFTRPPSVYDPNKSAVRVKVVFDENRGFVYKPIKPDKNN